MQDAAVSRISAKTPLYFSMKWSEAASTTCPIGVTRAAKASKIAPPAADAMIIGLRSAPAVAAEAREPVWPRERVRVVVTTSSSRSQGSGEI